MMTVIFSPDSPMNPRRGRNHGVQKICNCGRSRWPKCPHAWYFRFKPRGGHARWQFSLDGELGRHIGSKTEAEDEAAKIRAAIRAGTFRLGSDAAQPRTSTGVTLDEFAPIFIDRVAKPSGKVTWRSDEHRLALLREHRTVHGRRLGDLALAAITEDELEAFYSGQRSAGRAASTLNHLVQVVKAAFRWAAKKGYLARSPISDDSALKRIKVAQRRRRVLPDEEAALLTAAGGARAGGWTPLAVAHHRGSRNRVSAGRVAGAQMVGCEPAEAHAIRTGNRDRCEEERPFPAAADVGSTRGRPGDGADGPGGSAVSGDGVCLRAARTEGAGGEEGVAIGGPTSARAYAPLGRAEARFRPRVSCAMCRHRPALSRPPSRSRLPLARTRLAHSPRAGDAGPYEPFTDLDVLARGRDGVAGIDAAIRRRARRDLVWRRRGNPW